MKPINKPQEEWEKEFEKFNRQWEKEGFLSMDELEDFISHQRSLAVSQTKDKLMDASYERMAGKDWKADQHIIFCEIVKNI